ncbi:MAG: hypothetical protein ACTS2F_22855 [Thainema sp.]
MNELVGVFFKTFVLIQVLIYLALLVFSFLILGVADFSVAATVADPSKLAVIGAMSAILIAGGLQWWINRAIAQRNTRISAERQNASSDADQAAGCAELSTLISQVVGTIIYILLLPLAFSKIGEWIYQLNWWVFTSLRNQWPPLIYLLSVMSFLGFLFQNSLIYCEWLLGRAFFIGFLFPNQPLFLYTVVPAIAGLWAQVTYKLIKLARLGLERS